ncbi:MAG: DEAD/DEAH box helicase [archaeon]|jgi:Fanconi anemia group M protein
MAFIEHALIKKDTIQARVYQEVLVGRILENGNTLVVAPTALGKTIVAVLLAAHKLKEKNAKILFLAPTKPLVVQHERSFKRFLEIPEDKIISITGTTNPEDREKIYKEKLVINATPQTIENDILNRRLNLKDFELVIFDEAHRAAGDYSYVFINAQLQRQNPKALVVALTASPGGDEEKIENVCKNLSIKNIEIKNATDEDVKPYINEISIDWVKVDLPIEFKEIKQDLEKFQQVQLNYLKEMHIAINTNRLFYNRTRILEMQNKIASALRHGKNASLFMAASKCAALLKVAHAEELIETQGIGALKNYFDKIIEDAHSGKSKAAISIVASESIQHAMTLNNDLFEKKIQHPKYKELKKIILDQLKLKPESKILVFNQYRDSIKAVVSFLETEKEINVSKFIGQATKGKDKGMSQKKQQEVLDELKNGTHNVLVSSSVAEEGLDIPAVEMVIFFEPVPSEIRTIQRRGRTGRQSSGKNIILMTKGTRDEAYYWAAQAKETTMHTTLNKMKGEQLTGQSTLLEFKEPEEKKQEILEDILEDTPKENLKIKSKDDLKIESENILDMDSEELSNQELKKDDKIELKKISEKLFDDEASEIIIYVDSREQSAAVTKALFDKCKVMMKQLNVGDYVLSNDVCVERKTVQDFLESMIDGRLFKQLIDLRENYPKPLLILEGNPKELFNSRNIPKYSIIGALTSIALDYQIPIITTTDPIETAEYLLNIAKREQKGKHKEIKLRMGRKGLTLTEKQQFIVEGLPLVGPTLAQNMLRKFKTIQNIANATEEELLQVENLGKLKAQKIKEILDTKYKEE